MAGLFVITGDIGIHLRAVSYEGSEKLVLDMLWRPQWSQHCHALDLSLQCDKTMDLWCLSCLVCTVGVGRLGSTKRGDHQSAFHEGGNGWQ